MINIMDKINRGIESVKKCNKFDLICIEQINELKLLIFLKFKILQYVSIFTSAELEFSRKSIPRRLEVAFALIMIIANYHRRRNEAWRGPAIESRTMRETHP